MVELADTRDLNPRAVPGVRVRVPLSAPSRKGAIMNETEMRKFLQKLANQVDVHPHFLTKELTFCVVLEDDDMDVLRRFVET